jgi:hypothetical protein
MTDQSVIDEIGSFFWANRLPVYQTASHSELAELIESNISGIAPWTQSSEVSI